MVSQEFGLNFTDYKNLPLGEKKTFIQEHLERVDPVTSQDYEIIESGDSDAKQIEKTSEFEKFLDNEYGIDYNTYQTLNTGEKDIIKKKFEYRR